MIVFCDSPPVDWEVLEPSSAVLQTTAIPSQLPVPVEAIGWRPEAVAMGGNAAVCVPPAYCLRPSALKIDTKKPGITQGDTGAGGPNVE